MEKKYISVIVPCYNCEEYIEENIESIFNQTYEKFKVIYIDDGSEDNTLKILKEYEKKDRRIKVIHTENKGVAAARNLGITKAKGNYITFIDADDYIDTKYLETLYKNTMDGKIDYVKSNIIRTKRNEKININIKEKVYMKKNNEFDELYEKILSTYELNNITATLIKRDKINHLFKEEYNYAEDYLFNIEVIKNIDTFKYIDYTGYYYRENSNSLTHKFEKDKFINKFKMTIKAYKELYVLLPLNENKIRKRINREVNHILDSLFYYNNDTTLKERIEIYKKINEILKNEKDLFTSSDLYFIINKQYVFYDFKNYITKKIPRKIKHIIFR